MKKNKKIILIILILFSGLIAGNPEWAVDAIWYQIFPDRFYNGDQSNDPTIESMWGVWPWELQEQWHISPWTSDWYKLQPWEIANGNEYRYQFQIRRYGGDIQGIIDKLDYLQELGINAIYLNPVFDSPSSHKYGAAMYHHIDRHFGPDPIGDTKIIESEDPSDPTTWKWTSADKLFLRLIEEVHHREMHIIIDGVFNHVGLTFWAFEDVIENRDQSKYFDWFNIKGNGLPDASHLNAFVELPKPFVAEKQTPFQYTGYVEDLPAFRQDEYGPVEPVRNHLQEIVKRWMDPNGDGDPSDGIDGWRLDVAERVQLKFWDLFGKWVKGINPNAYITGEVWWEDYWNNKQFNAAPWLAEGRFDGVMNYRFADAMFRFFIDQEMKIRPSELRQSLESIISDYGVARAMTVQNLLGSHDMERFASAIVNPDRWIDHANNLGWNPEFVTRKPNEFERQIQKNIIAFQFSFIGAPYIYYGDEVGMWGADDPDCRKPMLWPDLIYENEQAHPCDYSPDCNYRANNDVVQVDSSLYDFYKQMIALRKEYPILNRGSYATHFVDDDHGIFAFTRSYNSQKLIAVFNSTGSDYNLPADFLPGNKNKWKLIGGYSDKKELKANSFAILISD